MNLSKQVTRLKRGRMWQGFIQFFILIVLLIRDFDTQDLLGVDWVALALPLALLVFFLTWLAGYLDERWGTMPGDSGHTWRVNPEWMEVKEMIKELHEKEVR